MGTFGMKRGEGVGLRIDIVTIFPGYFDGPLRVSLIGKAAARGGLDFAVMTCDSGRPTCTTPSMTPRSAVAPAW